MMKKYLPLILVVILSISVSCENTDSGGGDFALEAAGALAAASVVMGTDTPVSGSPSFIVLQGYPMRVVLPDYYVYSDGDAGTAIYTPNDNTISFDNFTVIFQSTSYVLDGLITCNNFNVFIPFPGDFTFAGDVAIEGGNLSGTYTVNLTVSLTLSGSDITATVTGTVDGESVEISLTAN